MKNNAKLMFEYINNRLASIIFRCTHKTSPNHFTRESPLGFRNTALIILNLIKKSIKVEVMNFFYQLNKDIEIPSRQALSQAREKISYLVFKDFFDKSCELAVDSHDARKHKGYRLFAIDGTTFAVGALKKLSAYFGETTSLKGKAMCRISAVVDVLNDCIVDACVSPFCVGERALAIEQVNKLKTVQEIINLFDRGYWSPNLVKNIINNGQKFLMRLASNVGSTIVKDETGQIIPLRRHSFVLPSGEVEVLLTNLSEEEFTNDDLAALYAKRWGAETKYLELKDRLQINTLSGKSVNVVLQDIYATLHMSNLVAFICFESDELIKEQTASKDNEYEQKTNKSTCISTLRRRFIDVCLLLDDASRNAALTRLYHDIRRDVVYIDKSKPRPRDKRQLKQSRMHKKKSVL